MLCSLFNRHEINRNKFFIVANGFSCAPFLRWVLFFFHSSLFQKKKIMHIISYRAMCCHMHTNRYQQHPMPATSTTKHVFVDLLLLPHNFIFLFCSVSNSNSIFILKCLSVSTPLQFQWQNGTLR